MKHHEQPTLSVVMIMVFIAIIVLILAALAICSHTSAKLGGIANRTSARPYRPLYRSSSTRSTRYGGALVAKDPDIVTNLTAALTNTLIPSNRYNTLVGDTVKTIEEVSRSANKQTGESSGPGTARNITDFQKMPDLLKSIIMNKQISADVFKTLKFEAFYNKQGDMRLPYYRFAPEAYWNFWGLTSNTDSTINIPTGINEFIQEPTYYDTITPTIADAFKYYLSKIYDPMDLSPQTNLVSLLNKYTMKTRQDDYKYVARQMLSEINIVIKPYEIALGAMVLTDPADQTAGSVLTTKLRTIKDNINDISTNLDTTPVAIDIHPKLSILINSTAADIDRLIDEIIALELKVSSAATPTPPLPTPLPPPAPPAPTPLPTPLPPLPAGSDELRISQQLISGTQLSLEDTRLALRLGLFNATNPSTNKFTYDSKFSLAPPTTDPLEIARRDNLIPDGAKRLAEIDAEYTKNSTEFRQNPIHLLDNAMNRDFTNSLAELYNNFNDISIRRLQLFKIKADIENELHTTNGLDSTQHANYITALNTQLAEVKDLLLKYNSLAEDVKDSLTILDLKKSKQLGPNTNSFIDILSTADKYKLDLDAKINIFTQLNTAVNGKPLASSDNIATSDKFIDYLKSELSRITTG